MLTVVLEKVSIFLVASTNCWGCHFGRFITTRFASPLSSFLSRLRIDATRTTYLLGQQVLSDSRLMHKIGAVVETFNTYVATSARCGMVTNRESLMNIYARSVNDIIWVSYAKVGITIPKVQCWVNSCQWRVPRLFQLSIHSDHLAARSELNVTVVSRRLITRLN
jgi:hypothetical protein